ncbi:uncharacterized protein BO88DRAFT_451602 [Aspergillus vadensis CBS 113365]|uniref:P-loop containing nucleoside triphosphate hydrolase protein n=1 Tax=Aspergillus vadensis (strain CBS 113365 / IMI 142717 / IBT 24658) TaxID=1448311 RepID=A0A319BCS7_ASPVC|nr:hypothetical protein BO88DRAFT_451602 [Aspergillus vadensis CBS 113365]PYH70906.1 hypothetical protein BO88DRAFT_451602 [Aspergillus vadensis CBS 113365]
MQQYNESNMEDYDESVNSSSDSSSIAQDSEFQEAVVEHQMTLLGSETDDDDDHGSSEHTPIIAGCALDVVVNQDGEQTVSDGTPQLGLLAGSIHKLPLIKKGEPFSKESDPRLFFNVSHPSSVFICGSQGSGKSHTLSCLLENCLIQSKAGKLPRPLTGLVFHYDTFFSDVTGSPCEAAFLSSHPDVKVRVLCSPTNVWSITQAYSRLDVSVESLYIDQNDLNTERMMDLMAVSQGDGELPLYMHTAKRILREIRTSQQETQSGFDYKTFKNRIPYSGLTSGQLEPLKQRLDMLESSLWEPKAGQLTILDLSCPCTSPGTACSLFNISLAIFMEQESDIGRVVALDEAHKYMKTSSEAQAFTETLLSVVRLQRHLAARIIISTQEPTVSTDLLNLCTVTIVHRFNSPEWLRILQKHLAGAATNPFARKKGKAGGRGIDGEEEQLREAYEHSIFDKIVNLRVGEALLFSPSSIVDVSIDEDGGYELRKLGSEHLAIKVRQRITKDGGKSVLAV